MECVTFFVFLASSLFSVRQHLDTTSCPPGELQLMLLLDTLSPVIGWVFFSGGQWELWMVDVVIQCYKHKQSTTVVFLIKGTHCHLYL
jgi:hypothetical protein